MSDPKRVWTAAEIAARPFWFAHPWRETAEVTLYGLSRLAGLSRAGVSLARLEAGRDSFPMHRHHAEEEWIYILEGRGELVTDTATHALGPGDFAAFAAGGEAHRLHNPGPGTLVYLMGGETAVVEIVDFPEDGRVMIRRGARIEGVPAGAAEPFDPFARLGRGGS